MVLPPDPPQQRRCFLFLQGPHGPFFAELGAALVAAGHEVLCAGTNRGDQAAWPDQSRFRPFKKPLDHWQGWLDTLIATEGVTDLVMYGDTRPIHDMAKSAGTRHNLTVHCFEEGYLRPYWITYERDGANGNSALMRMSVAEIIARIHDPEAVPAYAPATWGSLWHHVFYGSVYHANILFRNGAYPEYQTHRDISVFREWWLHIRRLALIPAFAVERSWATRRLLSSGRPFHVALLQLGHDAAMRDHSPMNSMAEFIVETIKGFAEGAPRHHLLVFKAHPLEDGREPIRKIVRDSAIAAGVGDRVLCISGGKLGPLLDRAKSAITVNSTAGQQVLWRGLPLKLFGATIYDKPEFVSDQSVPEFFAAPHMPDLTAYRQFRQFLLETSQLSGCYYTSKGRAAALRNVVDIMLAPAGPYEQRFDQNATVESHIRIVYP